MAEDSFTKDGFIIAFTFSMVTNLFGNILVCLVVVSFRDMRIPMNYLLVNLAVCDMMVAVFMSPRFVFSQTLNHSSGTLGDYLCKILTGDSFTWTGALASDFTLVCIAVERYLAINYPYSDKKRLTTKKLKYVIPACWVFAIGVNLPAFMYLKYDKTSGSCVPFWPTSNFIKYHSVINGQIFFVFPALIMGVLYALLVHQLWFKSNTASQATVTQQAVLKHRRHSTKMVITVSLIYCICWFPNCFAYIYVAFSAKQLFGEIHTASVLMVSLNSAINPIIYSLQSHRFRQHMAALLKRCHRNKVDVQSRGKETNSVMQTSVV